MAPPIKDILKTLKARKSVDEVLEASSVLIRELSQNSNFLNSDQSKTTIGLVVEILAWYGKVLPRSSPREEVSHVIRLLELLKEGFPLFATLLPEHFFEETFTTFTTVENASSTKLALVGLYVRLRSTKGSISTLDKWILNQVLFVKEKNLDSNVAFLLMKSCLDILKAPDTGVADAILLECLAGVYNLAKDVASTQLEPVLFYDFPFFKFTLKVIPAVFISATHASTMMNYLVFILSTWRKVNVIPGKEMIEDERKLVQAFATNILESPTLEHLKLFTNWAQNRRSARIMIECDVHKLPIHLITSYPASPKISIHMVRASVACLVNLTRKQVRNHPFLLKDGITVAVKHLIPHTQKPEDMEILQQLLALVLNLTSSTEGRKHMSYMGTWIVKKVLPHKDAKVCEFSLGVLWALCTKSPDVKEDQMSMWLHVVFTTMLDAPKDTNRIRRGLGALLMQFTLNGPLAIPLFKAKNPKYVSLLKQFRENDPLMNEDIALLIQMLE